MAVENLCAPLSLLLPGAPALLRTLIIFASEILSTTNSYDNFLSRRRKRGGERGHVWPDQWRQAKVPAGYLMWPGVLQVISLMMLHRRRCGIILFAAAAVPYLPLPPTLSAAPIPDDNLCKIYMRLSPALCVCSLQSRFSILMQLCQFWRWCPPSPTPCLVSG